MRIYTIKVAFKNVKGDIDFKTIYDVVSWGSKEGTLHVYTYSSLPENARDVNKRMFPAHLFAPDVWQGVTVVEIGEREPDTSSTPSASTPSASTTPEIVCKYCGAGVESKDGGVCLGREYLGYGGLPPQKGQPHVWVRRYS
jgi:hypothetical protein